MLQLSLRPGEYLTIHGDIVVQLAQLSGSRAFLRVEADRSIPIVRGKVLERSGAPRPECLASLPRSRARKGRDAVYHWSAERERAVRHNGTAPGAGGRAGDSREEAQALRAQLEHLLPTVWEEELSGQIQALFRSQNSPGRINNHLSLGFTRSREPVEINRSAGTQPAKGHGVCVGLPNH